MKIQKKKCCCCCCFFLGGGGVRLGGQGGCERKELKFLGKFTNKKNSEGGLGREGGQVGGCWGGGGQGGCEGRIEVF